MPWCCTLPTVSPKRKTRKVVETVTNNNKRNNNNSRYNGVVRKKRQALANKDSYITAELTERYEKLLNDPNAPRLNINDLTNLNIQELKEKAENIKYLDDWETAQKIIDKAQEHLKPIRR